jgi:hypothetical protein
MSDFFIQALERRPQFRDQAQDIGKEVSRDGDFRHLEGDVAAVAHHLRADLDQLLLQARQRPILDRFRRCQGAQEIAKIIGERMKLEPNGIGSERPARQPRPLDRALIAPLPSLIHCSHVPRLL